MLAGSSCCGFPAADRDRTDFRVERAGLLAFHIPFRKEAGLAKFFVPQEAEPAAIATLVQNVFDELNAMASMNLHRRQAFLGGRTCAVQYMIFSKPFHPRRYPRAQLLAAQYRFGERESTVSPALQSVVQYSSFCSLLLGAVFGALGSAVSAADNQG